MATDLFLEMAELPATGSLGTGQLDTRDLLVAGVPISISSKYLYLYLELSGSTKIKGSGGSRIFPRGGCEPSRGGMNTPNFPENCMKSKEFGRPGGGVRPSRPP